MRRSKDPVRRARLRRACALALVRIWTWVLLIGSTGLLLSACGGGGGGGGSSPPPQPPPVTNAPPVANAGADQVVNTGAAVSIGGSGSDSDGSIASYSWAQTGGGSVTLAGANTATASFTAPAVNAALEFRLTVTDNQGASHSDLVTVSVTALAPPVIAHHPTDVRAHEHASALFFVVASGENLSYEWIGAGGAIVKSASPEPFLQRGTMAGLSDNDRCYRVVVRNAAGSVTSEPGCLDVMPILGDSDPTDEDELDDWSLAETYGNSILKIVQQAAGPITGPGLAAGISSVPRLLGPRRNCLGGGEFAGSTLDGRLVTQGTVAPLGRHSLSMVWRECGNGDVDEPSDQVGGIMIDYDFPSVFGAGSYTIYFSGFGEDWDVLNGILRVTGAQTVSGTGRPLDEFVITVLQDFSVAQLRCECLYTPEIELTRRLNTEQTMANDATLRFDDLHFHAWNESGLLGTVYRRGGTSQIDLHFNPDVGDTGEPAHTSDGHVDVGLGTSFGSGDYLLAPIVATEGRGGGSGWRFNADPPEPPEDP